MKRWIYLGKGVESHHRARQRLGVTSEWIYDELLREKAASLRRPFLDFAARVGEEQADPVTWWSTRFSWKTWDASDFFLLTCYLAVAESCLEEAREKKFSLHVEVEDPWLLRQIKENIPLPPSVKVEGPGLWGFRLRQCVMGLARRGNWLLTTLRNRRRQRQFWPQKKPPVPADPIAGIFSHPSQNTFEQPGAWRDTHLPEVDRLLSESGFRVVRFTSPESSGWEKELSERSSFAVPLILWATAGRLLKSLTVFWPQRWPEPLELHGRSVRWLCLREWWLELGRSSLCAYRLFYECLKGVLSEGDWRMLVTFYENQPREKLQVLAARSAGVRTVGIQANLLSRYYFSFGLGKTQGHLPIPDRIGSSGQAMHQFLLEFGVPASSLVLCGAVRYADLLERFAKAQSRPVIERKGPRKVLVVLPIDPLLSRHLLEALNRAFPQGGEEAGLHFVIRAHPVHSIPKSWVRFPAGWSETTFTNLQEELRSCDAVLFTASTVGLEALAAGKTVVRYQPPRLLDLDEPYDPQVPVVRDDHFRAELLAHLKAGRSGYSPVETEQLIRSVFQPVDRDRLLELFGDTLISRARPKESHAFAQPAA